MVSNLLHINAYESAKTINDIFHLGVDFGQPTVKYELNRYKQKQEAKKQYKKWENKTFQLLCDYLHSLNKIQLYQEQDKLDYFIDMFIYGTDEDKLWFKKTNEGWCKQIERKLGRTDTRRVSAL